MVIKNCSSYHVDINVKNQGSEFFYQYKYQNHQFEGNVMIRAVSDREWLEAVFQIIVENEIEQYEINRVAEKYMGG